MRVEVGHALLKQKAVHIRSLFSHQMRIVPCIDLEAGWNKPQTSMVYGKT